MNALTRHASPKSSSSAVATLLAVAFALIAAVVFVFVTSQILERDRAREVRMVHERWQRLAGDLDHLVERIDRSLRESERLALWLASAPAAHVTDLAAPNGPRGPAASAGRVPPAHRPPRPARPSGAIEHSCDESSGPLCGLELR